MERPHGGTSIFKNVPGHPGWMACSDGHIYDRVGERLAEYRKEAGENRLRVTCQTHRTYHDVGRLIAETFLGFQHKSAVIHVNGDTADNRPENLRWVLQAGSNSNCGRRRRLSYTERHELHRQLNWGVPKTRIARALEISPRCVRRHANSCRCEFQNTSPQLL